MILSLPLPTSLRWRNSARAMGGGLEDIYREENV